MIQKLQHFWVRQQYPGVNRAPEWRDGLDHAKDERTLEGVGSALVRGAAGKAANLGGCKSLYRQLPETDG